MDPVAYQLPKYKQLKQQMDSQLPYEYPDVFGEHSEASSIVFGESDSREGFEESIQKEHYNDDDEGGNQKGKFEFSEKHLTGENRMESNLANRTLLSKEGNEDVIRDRDNVTTDHEMLVPSGIVLTDEMNESHDAYSHSHSLSKRSGLSVSRNLLDSSYAPSLSPQKHHSLPADISTSFETPFSKQIPTTSLPSHFKTVGGATLGQRIQFTLEKLQECAKFVMKEKPSKELGNDPNSFNGPNW